MRLTLPGYIVLVLLILGIIYLLLIIPIFFLALNDKKNSNSHNNITVSVPKQARVGDEIEVIVYYYPRLFSKSGLSRIGFFDSTGAHNYKTALVLDKFESGKVTSPRTLGLLPYYESFVYKIPKKVCPEDPVYDTCRLIDTKTGKGSIRLTYNPIISNTFGGEGYQGDGEKIEVHINIIK